ncbi:hypothetical protein V6O07_11440 [Arthrospira platensis SPKY2]
MMKKKVIIDTVGQIPIIGGITGPILQPFYLDVDSIRHLVAIRISVKEFVEGPNGEYEYVDLNLDNYETPHYYSKPVKVQPQVPISESAQKEVVEVVADEKMEEPKEQQPRNFNNKKKYRNQQNQNQNTQQ